MFLVQQLCGGFWKLRNAICFQGTSRKDMSLLLLKIATMLQNWSILCPQQMKWEFMTKLEELKRAATSPIKNRWLEMVNDPGKRFMFQEAQNWKALEIPEETKKYLPYNMESVSCGKSDQWFSLSVLKLLFWQ